MELVRAYYSIIWNKNQGFFFFRVSSRVKLSGMAVMTISGFYTFRTEHFIGRVN